MFWTLHLLGLLILITGQMKEASLVNILLKVLRHHWQGSKLNTSTSCFYTRSILCARWKVSLLHFTLNHSFTKYDKDKMVNKSEFYRIGPCYEFRDQSGMGHVLGYSSLDAFWGMYFISQSVTLSLKYTIPMRVSFIDYGCLHKLQTI